MNDRAVEQEWKEIQAGKRFLLFDGGMGTMLQSRGLKVGEVPEKLNLTHPEVVRSIQEEYVQAGAEVITTNTFGANRKKLAEGGVTPADVIPPAVKIAREAGAKYVALDIGPTGALLKPLGTMEPEEAYELFQEQVQIGAAAGADLVLIETMSDLLEMKMAILAAKENSALPIFATMTYQEDHRTFLGTDPKTATITLCSLGVDAVGVNCSMGPKELLPVVEEILSVATCPVIAQANAGLPRMEGGNTVYDITPTEYASYVDQMLAMGVTIVGGCCGTTPAFIREVKKKLEERTPAFTPHEPLCAMTSWQQTVALCGNTAVIGERINPTGKKKLKEALRNADYEYILEEAIGQQEAGADVLDVNAGLPEIDEPAVLKKLVQEIQGVCPLPLQIDSSDPEAVEAAVRVYSGKPIINSVNGSEESMSKILPIVKKYGAAVVCLTLDENGIPEKAEERCQIAGRVIERAKALGIHKNNILVDCLVLTASTNQAMVMETLRAIQMVKERYGVRTVLGVSNVSFGLPKRELLNATYLAAAFGAGLDMPILNPLSKEYQRVLQTFKVLNNEDEGSGRYMEACTSGQLMTVTELEKQQGASQAGAGALQAGSGSAQAGAGSSQAGSGLAQAGGSLGSQAGGAGNATGQEEDLFHIIRTGRKGKAPQAVQELLREKTPLQVIDEYFMPALDEVGMRFEKGEIFLPQLMSSAETVKAGFDVIKEEMAKSGAAQDKGKILVATVKGDIHDIGKNIVRMLLENYGYTVVDLGRDVEPERVVEEVKRQGIRLVGLSALMTTTVKNMKVTIEALREAGCTCKVMVGGAVLTPEYAAMVGADYYAKDAAEAARIAGEVLS